MSYILNCIVGSKEHRIEFDKLDELEEYAERIGLRYVATYEAGDGNLSIQYGEPEFETMTREARDDYASGIRAKVY